MKKYFIFLLLVFCFLLPSCRKLPETALPSVQLRDLSGKVVDLRQFQGRPLLINFWATWCGPCRIEIPMLNELHKKYSKNQLLILGVSTDDGGPETVQEFQKDVPMLYPVYMSTQAVEEKFGGIFALPTTYFYSKTGQQIDHVVGLQSRDYFEDRIHKIL